MGDKQQFISLDEPLTELQPRPSFAQRIQRALDLSKHYKNSSELLLYYGRLALYQQYLFDSYSRKQIVDPIEPWPLLMHGVMPHFTDFARSLEDFAPKHMRERASALAQLETAEQEAILRYFWHGDLQLDPESAADHFILLAFLQPYAESLAQSGYRNTAKRDHATCPVCASVPLCAVLRDQQHGARRSLICSICMEEWSFLRVACPSCGEERFESLPVFTTTEIPNVRVDACDNCKHYIKTVDMTKDGLSVPIVDELAAASLDLWAKENGYLKLSPNLVGL